MTPAKKATAAAKAAPQQPAATSGPSDAQEQAPGDPGEQRAAEVVTGVHGDETGLSSVSDEESTDPGYDSDVDTIYVEAKANLNIAGQQLVVGEKTDVPNTEEVADCIAQGFLVVADDTEPEPDADQ